MQMDLYGVPKVSKAPIQKHRYRCTDFFIGRPIKNCRWTDKNTGTPIILSVHRHIYRSTDKFYRCTDNIIPYFYTFAAFYLHKFIISTALHRTVLKYTAMIWHVKVTCKCKEKSLAGLFLLRISVFRIINI